MDEEQRKAARLELAGQARAEALAAFRSWLEGKRLAAPATEPLVLDFGLGNFRDVGLVECWIANEKAAGYCGKQLFVFDGQRCPLHRHRTKHETFFVIAGEVDMDYDGQIRRMRPGDVLAVSPGNPIASLALAQPCCWSSPRPARSPTTISTTPASRSAATISHSRGFP